jgi:5-methylcytosine-specific restriction endonuclease McrA
MSMTTTLQPDRAQRLLAILERDGATCVWCERAFSSLVPPTTDHLVPRVKGGPSWAVNELASCRRCNSQRGHATPALWLQECRRRGWSPDVERIRRRLTDLDREIGVRGGQRRARPYLASQLRQLSGI